MRETAEDIRQLVVDVRFPRSAKYDPNWVRENQMGPNALLLTEWLCQAMERKAGMRVLDMGCGRAISSVFLAREYDIQVWANDLWISATENWRRIEAAGLGDRVFPIHSEAHQLPYAADFFDAIVSIDAYHYFGTADDYLEYLSRIVRPGGQIGIVVPGLTHEFESDDDVQRLHGLCNWGSKSALATFHCADWWRRHWQRSRCVTVETADMLEDGWKLWLQTDLACGGEGDEAKMLRRDAGQYLAIVRVVARRM